MPFCEYLYAQCNRSSSESPALLTPCTRDVALLCPSGHAPVRDPAQRCPCRPAVRTWKHKALPALKKSDQRAKSHRLRRRIGIERTAHTGTYLGAHRSDADCSVPFQLEARLDVINYVMLNRRNSNHAALDFMREMRLRSRLFLKRFMMSLWSRSSSLHACRLKAVHTADI